MREICIGVVQCPLDDRKKNVTRVEHWVREAAASGAQVILTPELFDGPYFPQREAESFFEFAHTTDDSPTLKRFAELAKQLGVVLPVSFFERSGPAYYNSVAVFDGDGARLGVYRKSHIPDGPGYSEKFYFRPGDTGFQTWKTRFGVIGVGICWDQWFPETARAMALQGAEMLLYPTAIGSEPAAPGVDTKARWQRAMVGHAVSNAMPIAAANRIGREDDITFYGGSFLADHTGEKLDELGVEEEGFVLARIDLDAVREYRNGWGFFRDRRPDLYRVLLTADGEETASS